MPINFNFATKFQAGGKLVRDPRVMMRALIGVLLVANLAAAVIAFKPFGGSAADLTRQETALRSQLAALQGRIAMDRKLVDKVQAARKEGDDFLANYFMDRRTVSSSVAEELLRISKEAGMKSLPRSEQLEELTGSDTLQMATITAGFEGDYQNLTRLINLIDRSPRFFVIENMQSNGVQNGKSVSVLLKIDCFVRNEEGAVS
jgi:type IV pilus assembly protein PilO